MEKNPNILPSCMVKKTKKYDLTGEIAIKNQKIYVNDISYNPEDYFNNKKSVIKGV